MTTQLYHLIPEPAGDWQEGDRHITSYGPHYRLRPVKAQAGQLWRDDVAELFREYLTEHFCGILNESQIEHFSDKVKFYIDECCPVPAQACACEGLRTVVREYLEEFRNIKFSFWYKKFQQALAQSCPCQQSGEQPISEGGSGTSHAADEKACAGRRPDVINSAPSLSPPAATSEAQVNSSVPDWFNIGYVVYDSNGKFAFNCANIEGAKTAAASINATVAALRQHISDYDEENENYRIREAALRRELDEAKQQLLNRESRWQESERTRELAEADRDQWRDKARHWEAIKRVEVKP